MLSLLVSLPFCEAWSHAVFIFFLLALSLFFSVIPVLYLIIVHLEESGGKYPPLWHWHFGDYLFYNILHGLKNYRTKNAFIYDNKQTCTEF